MKKRQHFLILLSGLTLLSGVLLLHSCEKVVIPPIFKEQKPKEEEKEPSLEVVFPKKTIPYGEKNVTLTWAATNTNVLFINDEEQLSAVYGSKTIYDRVFADTLFVFKAVNKEKEIIKEVTIMVGDWTTSLFGLVSYYPWKSLRHSWEDLDGNLISWTRYPEELEKDVFSFHRDGRYTVTGYAGYQKWYIKDENTIVINNSEVRLRVDEKELILSSLSGNHYAYEQAWSNMHLVHASDIPLEP